MAARITLQVFDQYQRSRLAFVQSVADLAAKPANIECLEAAGVVDLLNPLLSDVVPSIQHMAAISLGRLAGHNIKLAQMIVQKDVLPQLLKNLDKQNKFYKKAALFVLRAIAKHSAEIASVVIYNNGLDAIMICLEDFDPGVKLAASWAVGYVARHNQNMAQSVVDAGAVPLLTLCLQEPELCLKQVSASAICDISKHTTELAQTVVDAGAIPFLAQSLSSHDVKMKRQVLSALGSVAKHSIDLAEAVVEADVFPNILEHLAHPDEIVRRAAATILKDICKHSVELAQLIVNIGGIAALIESISTSKSATRLPAIMAIGYIAGHSEQLAIAVIGSKGICQLAIVLHEETDDYILAVTAWAVGQIGKHSPEHAKAVAVANILTKLLKLCVNPKSSEDLKTKCNATLKQCLQKCMHIEALQSIFHDAPPNILKYILGQFSKILPNDAKARRLFVTSGGLKKVQEIQADYGSTLFEYITIINCCFPEEIVRYYSPGYPDTLLEAVEQYQPNCPSLFAMDQKVPSEHSESIASESLHHGVI